ncbi:isochorismatase family protein [Streptomyces sp. NPDC097981]|uniref:isochorismatase family protein n=1 Tax=Streptomyces sp. NPDC097981 TaxID=3155428 RepID=UPI003326BCF7
MSLPMIRPYELPDRACLRHNRLPWRFDPARAVLLVHDMQNYFLRPYTDPSLVEEVTGRIARLLRAARTAGIPVFYTRQPPDQDPQRRGLLTDLWGPGPGSRADDADITATLRPHPQETVVTKHRYSAFHGTRLADRLKQLGRNQIAVTGVYAHIGVLLTCADAFMHDIQPFLVADATADFDAESHAWAVRYAATRCAVVTLAANVEGALA